MLDLHAPSDGSCNFLLAHTHLCTSQDLKSLQAGSRYLRFVPLMVLFRFYYSEYLTHLCSPRLYPALRYSFPFLSPLVLPPPLLNGPQLQFQIASSPVFSPPFPPSHASALFFPPVHFPMADK